MYIDPNAGGMLFQVLAIFFGLFSGLILFFSGRIRLILGKLRRRSRVDQASPVEEQSAIEPESADES